MRLNKISKEVGMTPAEIVKILKKERKLTIENSPNFKLDDESVKWLLDSYKKEEAEILIEKQPEPEVSSVTEKIIAKAQAKKEEKTAKVEAITNEDVLVADGKIEAEIPELTGPKVIRKIDLPAPKIKTETTAEETSNEESEKKEIRRTRKPAYKKDKKREPKKAQVVLTEQEKREKEIEKALKQRERAKKAQKEKKKKAYLEKAAPVIEKTKVKHTKKKTEIRKKQQVESKKTSPKKEAPKGIFAKMWHWLNNAD